jgi:hypothetical protein
MVRPEDDATPSRRAHRYVNAQLGSAAAAYRGRIRVAGAGATDAGTGTDGGTGTGTGTGTGQLGTVQTELQAMRSAVAAHLVQALQIQQRVRARIAGTTTTSSRSARAVVALSRHQGRQQPTPMPPPHECVVPSAQWPVAHDEGAMPTHVPPAAVHVFAGMTQSKPARQPVAGSLRGTTVPPGQKPGPGGESAGQSTGGMTQSKPASQPFGALRGTILPPVQKPGAGGESAGHWMQQAAPMPGPHETFVESA